MPRKAKPTSHTAKEIKGKVAAALTNKGGGKGGKAQRLDARLSYVCPICKTPSPSTKSMEQHWDSKHLKTGPYDEKACQVEPPPPMEKVGVKGSIKKAKEKNKK